MKTYIKSLLATIFVLPLLLIGPAGLRHAVAAPMPDMMPEQTKTNDCLGACASQQQPVVTAINQGGAEREQEPTPGPSQSYYLQFLQFWPVLLAASAAYLLSYLRWRPPDIYKSFAVYRI